MKRMLCIVSSLDTGGAETMMMKFFRSFPDEYKMDFIVSKESGYYEEEVLQRGGIIYRVPLRTEHPIKTFMAIKKVVKDNNYKSVLKLCDTPKGYFDLLAAKCGGAKKLCVRSCNASAQQGKFSKLFCDILRPIFNHITDVKIAPSLLAAEFTFGKECVNNKDVFLLHNALDLEYFQFSERARREVREELGIMADQIVYGHIGRFNQQKNHGFLLEVFYQIVKQDRKAVLLLVGDGELREPIKNKIEEMGLQPNVLFLGVRSDIPRILSAMDYFVFPSLYEGMPNTVIEAQATGLPCAVSDSITKEAKIMDNIHYYSLKESPKVWAANIVDSDKTREKDQEKLREAGYDINEVCAEFLKLIF